MHILIAPDTFKGTLTAKGVIQAVKKGILRVSPSIKTYSYILSDGGDGFLNAVSQYTDMEEVMVPTVDPLGRSICVPYGMDRKTASAYIELSQASGITLLKDTERNVMETSTYGTGIQIKDAIEQGAQKIYIGLGGSATNDVGLGIAKALGYCFLDASGIEIHPKGAELHRVKKIIVPKSISDKRISFFAVNDVNNPLYGQHGAAHVYAKQKGGGPKEIELLDEGLKAISALFLKQLKKGNAHEPGAGAAGGTAYGLKTCLDAEFIAGTAFMIQLANIGERMKRYPIDLIITGEGKIDGQTQNGKLVQGILDLGKVNGIPVVAICGKSELNHEEVQQWGLEDVLPLQDGTLKDTYCMEHTAELIETRTFNFLKRYRAIG